MYSVVLAKGDKYSFLLDSSLKSRNLALDLSQRSLFNYFPCPKNDKLAMKLLLVLEPLLFVLNSMRHDHRNWSDFRAVE